jgi:hypothetical protein
MLRLPPINLYSYPRVEIRVRKGMTIVGKRKRELDKGLLATTP